MITKNVELIVYSKRVEIWNFITHAFGALLSLIVFVPGIIKSYGSSGARGAVSAVIYGLSLLAVYTVSAVYHVLPQGEAKRTARLVDHSTVPLLIAGTATPCALITLYNISLARCLLVFILAWLCFLFGAILKIFMFGKFKATCIAVYIISGAVMLCSAVPVIDSLNRHAFMLLIVGCAAYLLGGLLCSLGRKRPWLHPVFHVFVLIGSAVHYYVIFNYVF